MFRTKSLLSFSKSKLNPNRKRSVRHVTEWAKSPTNPANWKTDGALMYYESPNCVPSSKIASFGFNKALVTTSFFKRGPDAWTIRYATIPERLRVLHQAGFKLVIFANASIIGMTKKEEAKERAILQQTGRCGGLIESLGLPFQVFVSTGRKSSANPDPYRKPATGMWHYMANNCNGGVAIDYSESFFVGGAAGRQQTPHKRSRPDHDDYDVNFARNVGIKFYADDEFFGVADKQPGPKLGYKRAVTTM